MKFNLLILSIIVSSIAFNQDSIGKLPNNNLYILDSIQQVRSPKNFEMTSSDNYLQINEDYAVLSFTSRGKIENTSGKLSNPIVKIFDKDTVDVFTIISDNRLPGVVSGVRTFIGISRNYNTNHLIYLLNSPKQPEYFIKAHSASKKEEENLRIGK